MNVLIVDDEPPARARLRQLLEDTGEHSVVGEARNGQEALELCAKLGPDVILLDISMPGLNGIETAHHLNALETPPCVIFTTAYDRYAIEAFDARAVGYVLKPVRRERLDSALQQAARLSHGTLGEIGKGFGLPERRNHVCARVRGELKLIPLSSVLYFHADQKYVTVHHRDGEDLIDDSLKSLEEEFAGRFVRIHRKALVAVDKIDTLRRIPDGRTEVELRGLREKSRDASSGRDQDSGDARLVVSRRHLADVRRRVRGT
ncbi:MAG TPA: LytTR family DNA-binding domain-containing protein [Woeseiaceae bacterium]|nr:LytTR family DNA-binding domain-containing protein [Woeseiaceae bacterium]